MKNQTILFDSIAPYPEPVQIAELLSDIEAVIKKHVILKEQGAAALAVWVLHTYTFELRDTVAYVAIESPEKRCGKTTLLSVLAAMAHKPLIASNVTVGALFRAIDTCRPALFIDEADTFLAGNGTMRGIINSGNTWRTAYVLRMSRSRQNRAEGGGTPGEGTGPTGSGSRQNRARVVEGGQGAGAMNEGVSPACVGESDSPLALTRSQGRRDACPTLGENGETGLKRYSCWCPKVIAMIGRVPDTIADRSIVVRLSRKLVSETCAPLAELNTTAIRAKCVRFALDAGPAIAKAGKIRIEGLNDRAADTFDPLYVIARLAGNGWEQKLHAAALALAASAQSENSGTAVLLDILTIFVASGRERIFVRDLAKLLRAGFGGLTSPAMDYSCITDYQISQMLRPFGIRPLAVRDGKVVQKGYARANFQDALRRYVPEAEFEARLVELDRHAQLQAEAKAEADAEAAAEAAMMEEMLAQEPKEKAITLPSAVTGLRRL